MTRILIVYYSAYGHIYEMARNAAEGAKELSDVEVKLARVPEFEIARKNLSTQEAYQQAQELQEEVPEVVLDDLEWADGIIWGIPTRFGNMPAQIKQFLDSAGGLWQAGALEGKATGIITSTNTIHGGQETTIITSLIPLLHFGMVFVGLPYGENPEMMTGEAVGCSPYGVSTIAGPEGRRKPAEEEKTMARRLAVRVTRVATALKEID